MLFSISCYLVCCCIYFPILCCTVFFPRFNFISVLNFTVSLWKSGFTTTFITILFENLRAECGEWILFWHQCYTIFQRIKFVAVLRDYVKNIFSYYRTSWFKLVLQQTSAWTFIVADMLTESSKLKETLLLSSCF